MSSSRTSGLSFAEVAKKPVLMQQNVAPVSLSGGVKGKTKSESKVSFGPNEVRDRPRTALTWEGDRSEEKPKEAYTSYPEQGIAEGGESSGFNRGGSLLREVRQGKAKVKSEEERLAENYPMLAEFNSLLADRAEELCNEQRKVGAEPIVPKWASKENQSLQKLWSEVKVDSQMNVNSHVIETLAISAEDFDL